MDSLIISRNLDDVFPYNHIALMSLRIRSQVKAYIVLMSEDYLCINIYIISPLHIMLRLIYVRICSMS